MREKAESSCLMIRVIELQLSSSSYRFTVNAVYGYDQSDMCAHLSFHSLPSSKERHSEEKQSHLIQSIYQRLR